MKQLQRPITWFVALLIVAEMVVLYAVPGAGWWVFVFPALFLSGTLLLVIGKIANNLMAAGVRVTEPLIAHFQDIEYHQEPKEERPVLYSNDPLPEPLIGQQTEAPNQQATTSNAMEGFPTEIGVFFSTFQLRITGSHQEQIVSGLEAIQIHQQRMVLFYNDRSAFTGQLAGYDKKIAAHLSSFLRYLEYRHANDASMVSIQPLYERYISPVIAGYERLLNRVDYPAAHDALFPIKETGNKIQEYWDMTMQQKTQAA